MNERSTQTERFEWQKNQLGELISLEYGNSLPEHTRTGEGFPVYGSNGIVGKHSNYHLESPCIIVGRKGTVGAVVWSDRPCWVIDTAYYVQLKRSLDLRFIYWYLCHLPLGNLDSSTGVPGLNRHDAYHFIIKIPFDIKEQQRIAEILDTIDRAIARTESLIQKLKQIKAGLLHDLLTCGLDDNGELRNPIKHPEQFKDSLLGRIPKEWNVLPVDSCLEKIEQGWSPNCESSSTPIGKWGVLKTTAVVWEGYQDSENKLLPEHLKPRTAYEVKSRDVLMTRAGPNSRVGVVVFVKNTQGKLTVSDKLYRLVPKDIIKPKFLTYVLSSSQTQTHLSRLKTGLAESQTNISQDIVRALWICLPKIKEQNKITKVLDIYDTRIRKEEAYRDKLKLQKKGLMQDLLTGKVRVK